MIGFDHIGSPGQLGNQMFKYASLKGIAKKNNLEYCIPPNKYTFIKVNPFSRRTKLHQHRLLHVFEMKNLKNLKFTNYQRILREKSFAFDHELYNNCPDKVQINGFFQSEKYFSELRKEILEDFSFKKKVQHKVNLFAEDFGNFTSIHVRRNDFISNPNHSELSVDYYKNAIKNFSVKDKFIVFTDDIGWVKSQKLFKGENIFCASDLGITGDISELCLMTKATNSIIANSTFSWWGAWLSNSKNIITPKLWFKNSQLSSLDTTDLIPERWMKVSN